MTENSTVTLPETNPGNSETLDALMQRAIALHQQGQVAEALPLYQEALRLAPGHADIHYLVGIACVALKQEDAVEMHLDATLTANPDHIEARLQRGLLHFTQTRYREALDDFQFMTVLAPQDPRGWINLAAISVRLDDLQTAAQAAERALQLDPKDGDAWNNLGNALLKQGDFTQAETAFRRALQAKPDNGAFWQNLADALRSAGRLHDAEKAYHQALALNNTMPGCWTNYGNLLNQLQREAEAMEAYRRALDIDPDYGEALASLAGYQIGSGQEHTAIATLRPRVESGRASSDQIAAYAYALRAAGEIDAAQTVLREQLEGRPLNTTLIHAYGEIALTRKQMLPQAVEQTQRWLREQGPKAPLSERTSAYILLAQLLDKLGHHAAAFAAATQGKHLKGKRSDPAQEQTLAAALERNFNRNRLRRPPYGMPDEERPVFIVGLPRSGTSLLEQMLAAHPAVYPCGEVGELEMIVQELAPGAPQEWPRRAIELDALSLQTLAARYLHILGPEAAGAVRVIDKMPHNFVNIGLIHLLFPRARIIHIQRDPRDVALSIFMLDFAGHHPYANHIEDIAQHILFYRRCMAHWRDVLQPDTLHELRYEELVADPEPHARALLEFIGLPWDENVLRPENIARTILTSSRFQVKEPIHRRAAGRWKPYARELRPLTAILGPNLNHEGS